MSTIDAASKKLDCGSEIAVLRRQISVLIARLVIIMYLIMLILSFDSSFTWARPLFPSSDQNSF
jgi:hypothetical protein